MKKGIAFIVNFIKETRSELRKVVWPERRYVMVATIIILFLVVLTGLYVMGVDFVYTKIFGYLIR